MKELCIRCGKETEYDINTPVKVRRYFIEGAGQLCEDCFQDLYAYEVNTIDYRVSQIKDLMQHKEPISIESVRSMTSKYYNLSFYEAYVNWCEDSANQVGDYKAFADDLKRQASRILGEFSQKDFEDYQFKTNDEFFKYCDTLKLYKASRKGLRQG